MTSIKVVLIIHSTEVLHMVLKSLSKQEVEVVTVASNGVEGFNKVMTYSPDVVLLDLDIPAMDGKYVVENILAKQFCPIIVLGNDTSNGRIAIEQALDAGAMNYVKKPIETNRHTFEMFQTELIKHVLSCNESMLKERNTDVAKSNYTPNMKENNKRSQSLIVIGTSTGGPRALQNILTNLPDDFHTPILIVQHMPQGFTRSLAKRLNHLSSIHVKEAEDGEEIKEQTAYIAPGGQHMVIQSIGTKQIVQLTDEPLDCVHRPSVDVLFTSVAHIEKVNKIAVILTGMGKDGSEGIVQLKKHDAQSIIISQSKESSTVYGMPKAAIETNLVDYTVPLNQISRMLVQLVKKIGGN